MSTKSKSQLERFKETAKQLEADQSDDALDDIMGKLNFEKPKEDKPKKDK